MKITSNNIAVSDEDVRNIIGHMTNGGEVPQREFDSETVREYVVDILEGLDIEEDDEQSIRALVAKIRKFIPGEYRSYKN